ncbi:cyclase family protein [Pseudonocardia sp. MH-G8]|uniref:cyclase family protein n=1 Tax=Pseudonocardia sp. MH-G8 TaxID=1854588 RepID=UPI000BA0DF5C|nr:cyclase family protein [Pseudonocardia sp. MH-G8]OZM77103.1 cyclase [Pseudonocardia sp. MH-G8]
MPPTDDVPFDGDGIIHDYIDKYSNWGRWGEDDQLGALNHVGPEQVRAAAALVRQGRVVSMTLPLDLKGPQSGGFRANPLNMMTATGTDYVAGKQDPLPGGFGPSKGFGFADDVLVAPNQAGSQWDGLAHIFWKGKMYNGFDAGHVTASGAGRCGIEVTQTSFVMRGVLLDVARHKGVDCLDPGYTITADDLDATAARQGVEVRTGDALIVRTGMTETRRGDWGDYNGGPAPGLSLHTAPWLHAHDVAALATDTWGCEVRPNEIDLFQPLHVVALVHMGIPFGEIWDLQAIGADCAADGVYEFMLTAPTLPITGAAGSPLNALAIK